MQSSSGHPSCGGLRGRSKKKSGWVSRAYATRADCADAPSRAFHLRRGGEPEFLERGGWLLQEAVVLELRLEPALAQVRELAAWAEKQQAAARMERR